LLVQQSVYKNMKWEPGCVGFFDLTTYLNDSLLV